MIHFLYVGHFQNVGDCMALEKREGDRAPRPVVVRPLDMATIGQVLAEQGIKGGSIPDDWGMAVEEEGFILCSAHIGNRDAIDFLRHLALKTGCDIFYDLWYKLKPDDLTLPVPSKTANELKCPPQLSLPSRFVGSTEP